MKREEGFEDYNPWTGRFMAATIIQGAVIAGLTIFLVLGHVSVKTSTFFSRPRDTIFNIIIITAVLLNIALLYIIAG